MEITMKFQSLRLGKLAGIPVYLDYSWFLIFILITWTLATSYFPSEFKTWPVAEYWIVGGITAILLFISVLLHEIGHSVVAMRYKIPVRKITLFIFGGIAQIGSEPPYAMAEFWIAIAGPMVSFALAGLFGILQPVFTSISPILALAKYLAYINGTLGLFNLIPGFPLDGGRVFRAIVWGVTHNFRRATLIAANVGRLIAFIFIIFGVWQMISGNFGNGLWIAFIGWFLESAANAQVQQQIVQDLLVGHTVSQAMSRNFTVLSPYITLQELMDLHILGEGRRFFIVKEGDKTKGLLTLHQIKQVPREEWNHTTIGQRMIPVDQAHAVAPDMPLIDAIKMMDNDGVNQLPVIDGSNLLGILSRESMINFLRTLQDLGYPQSSQKHFTSGS
jgi:Zn-dependent protease/CBS domain-containing protein